MHACALSFTLQLLSLSPLFIYSEADKHINGFSIDLIHRDSPLSPFHNSSMTQPELLQNAALRSMSRVNRFHLSIDESSELAETDIIPSDGSYLMKLFIGTPPVETWAIADTGSDLVWVQCSPCLICYPQNAPFFNPADSSTYVDLSCDSKPCTFFPKGYSRCGISNECEYYYTYGDNSYTTGNLATDSIHFGMSGEGQSVSFPKSVFGCGHSNNGGSFSRNGAGLVGLGNGPLSLVSQLGDTIGRKFSYCLPPFEEKSTTKLRFGEEATISGKGVVSTPLITDPNFSTYYYLNLKGITVGQKTVETGQSDGNIVIDSGTTLTYLPSSFYSQVEALMKEAIDFDEAVVQNPPEPWKLCYASQTSIKNFPDFVVHFEEADLALKPENIFVPINPMLCFGVVPSDRFSLYGNVAQFNFQVEHDLGSRKVSFAPADCAKQ